MSTSEPDPMSPGTYVRKRREAVGLSIAAVAAQLATDPSLGEIDRRTWLEQIEADLTPVTPDVIAALLGVPRLRFDPLILDKLARRHRGEILDADVAVCRVCACSWCDACPGGCFWAEPDTLCSSCLDVEAHVDAIHAAAAGRSLAA